MIKTLPCLLTWHLLWIGLLLTSPVFTQGEPADSIGVILILDNSGSMESSDPENLRFTAARLFISLLEEGDSVGVILFSTTATRITKSAAQVAPGTKNHILNQIQPTAADGYTDFKAAFVEAKDLLSGMNPRNKKLAVVFLTDGKPELPLPYKDYETETLRQIESLGVPVLSIALTQAAQTPFLNQVASATQGIVIPAGSSSDLLNAYLKIFSQIKNRTLIQSDKTQAPGIANFVIDSALAPYLHKVSFIVAKPSTVNARLVDPGNRVVVASDTNIPFLFTNDPGFAIMTVDQPAPGNWQLVLEGKGDIQAYAILHARLRLNIDKPDVLQAAGSPFKIVVHLTEDQEDGSSVTVVGAANFSALITRPDGSQESLDRFYDDGTNGDDLGGDGLYTRSYTNTDLPGSYTIAVQGWKDAVPVQQVHDVEAIQLPAVVVDTPLNWHYEVRDEGIPLGIHLERVEPGSFLSGDFIAQVTAPSGTVQEIELEEVSGRYSGIFYPCEAGLHQVDFISRQAYYQGLPYNHTTRTQFDLQLIPQITIQNDAIYLGNFEIQNVGGISFQVSVDSNSTETEILTAHLEAMEGFSLSQGAGLIIEPAGTTAIKLAIQPVAPLKLGELDGQVSFSAREGVDVIHPVIDLHLSLYQPSLIVSSVGANVDQSVSCQGWTGDFGLVFTSTSQQIETIDVAWTGADVLSIDKSAIQVAPGSSDSTFAITPTMAQPAGEYSFNVSFHGREGLDIDPKDGITFRYENPTVWSRCQKPIRWGMILFISSLGLAGITVRKLKIQNRPPSVSGTLRFWHSRTPMSVQSADLTQMKRSLITIGRSPSCDIVIEDPSVLEQHAILQAEKNDRIVQILLVPAGPIQIGYRFLQTSKSLEHGEQFMIGNQEFQYLSDEGE